MRELNSLREGWDLALRARQDALRRLTVEEGLAEFLSLCAEFSAELDRTEPVFRPGRIQAMRELQARLASLSQPSVG